MRKEYYLTPADLLTIIQPKKKQFPAGQLIPIFESDVNSSCSIILEVVLK